MAGEVRVAFYITSLIIAYVICQLLSEKQPSPPPQQQPQPTQQQPVIIVQQQPPQQQLVLPLPQQPQCNSCPCCR